MPVKWCVWPWSHPADIGARLTARGLTHWHARGMSIPTDAPLAAGSITVRRDEEGTDYAAVWAGGWQEDHAKVRADVAALLAEGKSRLFVAYDGAVPVGIAAIRQSPGAGYLLGAVVLPAYRGRGACRALLAARLHDLHARGIPLAVTHAREATSAPILEALGFRTEFRYRVFFRQ